MCLTSILIRLIFLLERFCERLIYCTAKEFRTIASFQMSGNDAMNLAGKLKFDFVDLTLVIFHGLSHVASSSFS